MVRTLILAATFSLALPITASANTEEDSKALALVKRGQALAASLNGNADNDYADDLLIQEVSALIKDTQDQISLSCFTGTGSGSKKACYLVTTLLRELSDLFPSENN